jgi:hypothetical protein
MTIENIFPDLILTQANISAAEAYMKYIKLK